MAENEFKWKSHEKTQYDINYSDAEAINDQMRDWNVPLRGHAVTWSVPGKNPTWFETSPTLDALYNRTDDVVSHFGGAITQWDVLNEPLHGNVFKAAFPDHPQIWTDMIDRVKVADSVTKIAVNDYDLVRADKGRCFNHLVEELTLDYTGLQSHMHPGLNGHFLKNRFDALAYDHNDAGRRLFVTEFDIDNDFDVAFKAEDLDDFMRIAFSHPAVDGIITWKWLWHEERYNGPVTKHFFDSRDKEGAADNGTWPFYPNEAGNRWLDLVKGEWNSTQDLTVDEPSLIDAGLYYGDYEIVQKDISGNVIHTDTVSVVQNTQCTWSAGNMVDGEFDSETEMASWQFTGSNFGGHQTYTIVNFDAYAGNALKHTRSDAGQLWLSTAVTIPESTMYTVSFMAKWDVAKQLKVSLGDEEMEVLSWGQYEATEWTRFEAELSADADTTLVVKVFGVQARF